jgi:hypothetical protein
VLLNGVPAVPNTTLPAQVSRNVPELDDTVTVCVPLGMSVIDQRTDALLAWPRATLRLDGVTDDAVMNASAGGQLAATAASTAVTSAAFLGVSAIGAPLVNQFFLSVTE